MESLLIEQTEDSPRVVLDPENNTFEISNRSLPENAIEFYQPVFDWLKDYTDEANERTDFCFMLEYFNTASAKQIAKILLVLEKLSKKSKVVVKWYYEKEDTDMYTAGSRYSKLINVDFEFIEQ